MYQFVLILHLLGAAVWTGGHLVLVVTILPRALRAKDPQVLVEFESAYEPLGLAALATQVITGLWLAYYYLPDPAQWFALDSTVSIYLSIKFVLLALTLGLALDARLRLVPRLDATNLWAFAYHIIGVAITAVLFIVAGVGLGTGGFF